MKFNWIEFQGNREMLCKSYNISVKSAAKESHDYDVEMQKIKRDAERLMSQHAAMMPR
jgi:hypothetical protein